MPDKRGTDNRGSTVLQILIFKQDQNEAHENRFSPYMNNSK